MNASRISGWAVLLTILLGCAWRPFDLAWSASPPSPPFDYSGLTALIGANEVKGVRTVEGLLEALPTEMRSRYALAFKSHSLQKATPEQPRIILANADSTLFISIAGDPASREIEVMTWDPDAQRFNFREISFPADPAKGSVAFNPKDPRVQSPASCRGCHGTDPRPIWNQYHDWPGFFGSSERGGVSVTGTRQEKHWYARFDREGFSRGRYAFLVRKVRDIDSNRTETAEAQGQMIVRDGARLQEITSELTSLMHARNVRMLMEQPTYPRMKFAMAALAFGCPAHLTDKGDKKATSGRPSDYDSDAEAPTRFAHIERFLLHSARIDSSSFDSRLQTVRRNLVREAARRRKSFLEFSDGYGPTFPEPTETECREPCQHRIAAWQVVLGELKVDSRDLALPFLDRSFPEGGLSHYSSLEIRLLRAMAANDPELAGLRTFDFGSHQHKHATPENRAFCDDLLAKSLARQRQGKTTAACETCDPRQHPFALLQRAVESSAAPLRPLSESASPAVIPYALRTCISCHSGPNASAVPFPFHDCDAMRGYLGKLPGRGKPWLRKVAKLLGSADPRVRMPKDRDPLSRDDQSAILRYLDQCGR